MRIMQICLDKPLTSCLRSKVNCKTGPDFQFYKHQLSLNLSLNCLQTKTYTLVKV